MTQFRDEGYLPEAMINYLARLGWSHGDDEVFSSEQFLKWFDLDHLGRSASQFDEAKLRWVNAQHIKASSNEDLLACVLPILAARGIAVDASDSERLAHICALLKDRCDTTVALADWVATFYAPVSPSAEDMATHVTEAIRPAIADLADAFAHIEWHKEAISATFKSVLQAHALKMPQLAMPVRVLVMGTPNTPSVDAMLALHTQKNVTERLRTT